MLMWPRKSTSAYLMYLPFSSCASVFSKLYTNELFDFQKSECEDVSFMETMQRALEAGLEMINAMRFA